MSIKPLLGLGGDREHDLYSMKSVTCKGEAASLSV